MGTTHQCEDPPLPYWQNASFVDFVSCGGYCEGVPRGVQRVSRVGILDICASSCNRLFNASVLPATFTFDCWRNRKHTREPNTSCVPFSVFVRCPVVRHDFALEHEKRQGRVWAEFTNVILIRVVDDLWSYQRCFGKGQVTHSGRWGAYPVRARRIVPLCLERHHRRRCVAISDQVVPAPR